MAELTGPESIVNAARPGLLKTLTAVAEGVPITEIERDDVRKVVQIIERVINENEYWRPGTVFDLSDFDARFGPPGDG